MIPLSSAVLITVKEPNDSNYTTYLTTQNVASQRNIGLSINYSKQITPAWTLNVFLNVYNNHYKGIIDSTNVDAGFTSFNANFNTQYSFKKGWTGELSGFYYAKDYVSSVIQMAGACFGRLQTDPKRERVDQTEPPGSYDHEFYRIQTLTRERPLKLCMGQPPYDIQHSLTVSKKTHQPQRRNGVSDKTKPVVEEWATIVAVGGWLLAVGWRFFLDDR
jgi:hypothetical protein